jgi:hypothetical protein
METDEQRLKQGLDLLVGRAAAQGVPLSKIPVYLDMIMKRNGVSAEKRISVLQMTEDSIDQVDGRLIA